MATSLLLCDICMADDTTKSASVWCSECEEAICNDCEKQHSRMKLTKSHKTILIEDYKELPRSVAGIKQECNAHNRKLDFYCLIHNEPCCVSCVSEKHGICQTLKPLTEVVDGVKSSAAFEDLEDRAKFISELIGNLIKDKQDNKARIEFKKKTIISEVQNVRKAIIYHLDKLQTDLLNKLDTEEKKQCESIGSFIEKISKMRKNVDGIVNDLKQIKQHASDYQAFLGIHEWNKKIEVEEKVMMSLQTDQMMDSVDIQIEYSPILKKLEKDVKEIGKLEVIFSSSKKILLNKEKQGQILVSVSNSVDDIRLACMCSFQTPVGVSSKISIKGIDMFDDGRIVLADNSRRNKRLVIMNPEGEFIKTVQLEDCSYDVAVIDKDNVATTLVSHKKIVIVEVKSSKVKLSIPTNYKCYGITYTGKLLIASLEHKTCQFFDLSGNTLSGLSTVDVSSYCSIFHETCYYTAHENDAVYSTKLNGELCWKFDCQTSDYPNSLTNDGSGNIFVACMKSNQLLAVGKDGKKSRILLSKEDGLKEPHAVHYNRNTNILLVCNISGQCFLYNVTN